MNMKDARKRLDELLADGIKNREQLNEALPLLIELKSMTEVTYHTVRACQKLIKNMANACSDYAISHPSAFVDGLQTVDGVQVGDVRVGDILYHLASGYDGYRRIDGENMDQTFLGDLPKKWVRGKFELDTTAINRAHVSLEELEANGLCRSPKITWAERTCC